MLRELGLLWRRRYVTALPGVRWLFPTARLRRYPIYGRKALHAWFRPNASAAYTWDDPRGVERSAEVRHHTQPSRHDHRSFSDRSG